jgi:hypothetical protein
VHDGKLAAAGRLFNTDTVIFNVAQDAFPNISAELYVNAYVYQPAPPAAATPSTPTDPGTTTPPPSTDTSTPPSGASATGVTP